MDSQTRIKLLNKAFGELQMATQWPLEALGVNSITMAESIVEVLEAEDCGSIGGYDPENRHVRETGFDVFDRFLTVVRKHNDGPNIEPRCGASLRTLTAYFTRLENLRDQVFEEVK